METIMKLRLAIVLACTLMGLSACVVEPFGGGGERGGYYVGAGDRGGGDHGDNHGDDHGGGGHLR
jgi:hypothetical protein